jgi:D-glycero-alpha-D-manno-heptose-7-phosphate kinase
MIISQTPHRISFFGGGTDYPNYYLEHEGRVLGVAIDKYCYLNVRKLPPFFGHKHRIVYSEQENVSCIDEIKHPSVRETLRYLEIEYGVSIHHDGDIPARSGMGSSSAFTVGLLKSMLALEGRYISKSELTEKAIFIEQQLIRENVGSQDQVFAGHGGLNLVSFLRNGEILVEPVIMTQKRIERFESSLLLYYTGISRFASDVAVEQIRNTHKNIAQLNAMKQLVDKAFKILTDTDSDLDQFGHMLHETWKLKKSLSSKITTPEIDSIYETAVRNGAIGGKLLGAGGGGFLLFYCPPKQQHKLKMALSNLLYIPFKFDFNGSQIIVYQPNS